MAASRVAGILLHPTSLPGPYGIGELGREAITFLDFLHETGQSLWQVLPLGPTGFGDSPYSSFSAFAGNPLLISLDRLAEQGLLEAGELAKHPAFPRDEVDFGAVREHRRPLLVKDFEAFENKAAATRRGAFDAFVRLHAAWLGDFALSQESHREVEDAILVAPHEHVERGGLAFLATRDEIANGPFIGSHGSSFAQLPPGLR